jgi:exosortase A
MSAMASAMHPARTRALPLLALGALLVLLGLVYHETLQTIGAKWFTDMSYSHGGLVLPISLWLIWRRRGLVLGLVWTPSGWGVLALAAASLVWLVARAAGILVAQQLAVVAMISSLVFAVLGWQAYRALAFPLTFLVFAVPFGRGLVPWLMQVTADITASALAWTGVPVFRHGMLLSIPAGDFEVARACSGLNYLITGIVLGTLYAWLTYTDWRKRAAFIAASVGVLILANGMRAYLTVAIAHWSDMRYGTGYDHIVFGRIMFLAVILIMFWIGQRWRDAPVATPLPRSRAPAEAQPRRVSSLIVAGCALLIIAPSWYLSAALHRSGAARTPAAANLALPPGRGTWHGPRAVDQSWRPLFSGAAAEEATTYLDGSGGRVELYVGLYELGKAGKEEMISYRNRLYLQEHRSLLAERPVAASLDGAGTTLAAREILVPDADGERIVWYWFMIGEQVTASRSLAKALEAAGMLTGRAQYGRVITLATRANDTNAGRRRLAAFVRDHGACVRGGFAPPQCAG